MTGLDPRLNAVRPDLAAAALRGRVEAARFTGGERFVVRADVLDLKRRPRPDAPLDTQLLHGEIVTVYDEEDGWAWVQAERDGYVGYAATHGLGQGGAAPTHRVTVNRTFVYPAADMKQPVFAALPLDGRVAVVGTRGTFSQIEGAGFVFAAHLAPIERAAADFVAIAEQLVGVPYLWGGKSGLGIDCSGLVQLSTSVAGTVMPRDTDMQERLGEALPVCDDLAGLRRGDLVFWAGHVGIMLDPETLLHANAYHMLVAGEPLRDAACRIRATNGPPISSIRRGSLASSA